MGPGIVVCVMCDVTQRPPLAAAALRVRQPAPQAHNSSYGSALRVSCRRQQGPGSAASALRSEAFERPPTSLWCAALRMGIRPTSAIGWFPSALLLAVTRFTSPAPRPASFRFISCVACSISRVPCMRCVRLDDGRCRTCQAQSVTPHMALLTGDTTTT
jgi:hypothetical protein